MPEGSDELSSRSRRDHSSIRYLGILTLAGETFGKLSVTRGQNVPNPAATLRREFLRDEPRGALPRSSSLSSGSFTLQLMFFGALN
jgi:hypothetical protein